MLHRSFKADSRWKCLEKVVTLKRASLSKGTRVADIIDTPTVSSLEGVALSKFQGTVSWYARVLAKCLPKLQSNIML